MSSYFALLKSVKDDVVLPAAEDILRSAPDSLFLGSAIFAGLTQNFALGTFVLAMVEFGILHRVLAGIIGLAQPNEAPLPASSKCFPGIPSPYQISAVGQILTGAAFPSGPLFFISAAISYILYSTLNFSSELNELSKTEPEWKVRIPLSITFSLLLIAAFGIYRFVSGCDPALVIIGSTVLGLFVGALVYTIHVYLFGRNAVNFLGLPLLADRSANGSALYVCAKKD